MSKTGSDKAKKAPKVVEYETPKHIVQRLDDLLYGWTQTRFELDTAASAENRLFASYFTAVTDGLRQQWHSPWYCNWPYGRTTNHAWSRKCSIEGQHMPGVALMPGNADDSAWFHEYILSTAAIIVIFRGRIHFELNRKPLPHPDLNNKAALWLGRKRRGSMPKFIVMPAGK